MSTRWQIVAKLSEDEAYKVNGDYGSIYVHCDGYPDRVLPLLKEHYSDQSAIDGLIGLGDCLTVYESVENCEPFARDEPWEDVCPTYGDDLPTVVADHRHGDENYCYTWDGHGWTSEDL